MLRVTIDHKLLASYQRVPQTTKFWVVETRNSGAGDYTLAWVDPIVARAIKTALPKAGFRVLKPRDRIRPPWSCDPRNPKTRWAK